MHNIAIRNIILKNFRILQNNSKTKQIFPLPPSFRIFQTRQKHKQFSSQRKHSTTNYEIRQPTGYLLKHAHTMDNLSFRPKRHQDLRTLNNPMINTNDRYAWVSTNVIYCIKIYKTEIERELAERFREQLRDVQEDQLRAISTSRTPLSTTWQSHGKSFPTPSKHRKP